MVLGKIVGRCFINKFICFISIKLFVLFLFLNGGRGITLKMGD